MKKLIKYSRSFVKKYGTLYTWTRATHTYVPASGTGSSTSVTYSAKAILKALSVQAVAQSGGLMHVGDLIAYVSDASYTPAVHDTVSIESATYQVFAVTREPTSNFYSLQLRKK